MPRKQCSFFRQTGDQKLLARSLASLGLVNQVRGNLSEAETNFKASLEISRREGFKDSCSHSLMFLGIQAYWQGHFQHAEHLAQEGLAVSRDTHDGFYELFNHGTLGLECWGVGNYAQAFQVVHEGIVKAKCSGQVKTDTKLSRPDDFFVFIGTDIPKIRMLTPTVVEHLDRVDDIITGFLTRQIIARRRALALQTAKKPLRYRIIQALPRSAHAALTIP